MGNVAKIYLVICLLGGVSAYAQTKDAAAPGAAAKPPAEEEWPDLSKELEWFSEHGPRNQAERTRISYLQQEMVLRAMAAANGDFHITGKVVDEDGNPVNGVKLEIARCKPVSLSDMKKAMKNEGLNENDLQKKYYQRETTTIDGKFEVKAAEFSKLLLTFTKDGYEMQSRNYQAGVASDQMRQLMRKNGKVPKWPLVKEDITVVLEKIFVLEKEAKLKWGRATFKPRADGSVVLLDLTRKYGGGVGIEIAQTELPALPSADKIPPNRIWLTAPIDEAKGVFKAIPIAIDQRKTQYIAGQTLRISGKDAGFILFHPKKLAYAWREMGEAPKEGYKNELDMTPELAIRYLASGGERQNGIYFYIRTADGKYGKGIISGGWELREDESESCKELTIDVALRIQPDGTRNLQTRE